MYISVICKGRMYFDPLELKCKKQKYCFAPIKKMYKIKNILSFSHGC